MNLLLAMGSDSAPRDLLLENGWQVENSLDITQTLDTYRDFNFNSNAEFSVAKHGYVTSRSGWFSERSINYMAAGRPVIVQDTGFSYWLPTGEGVLAFTTVEEAVECLERVYRNGALHRRAAREIAVSYFCSDTVLKDLLDSIFCSDSSKTKDQANDTARAA